MLSTRREFLASATATLVAGTLRAAEDSPSGPFKVGAQSYSFRDFKLEQALRQYQTLGLKYAEFFRDHIPLNSTPEQIAAVLKLCKEYGVTPLAFGVESFGKDHDKNRQKFEFGKALGIKALSADPDPNSFDSLDKLCDEYKIAIAIHPHGPSQKRDGSMEMHRWYSADVILPAVKDHHPLIGTCIDTGHILRCILMDKLLDPVDQIRKMGNRNFGIHLKDFDATKKTEVNIGQGMLNVPGIVKALKDVKFTGCLSLEYELNSKNPTPDMAEGLKVLQAAIQSTT
jgi:sugar phosphate isomerase/epimerase